MELLQDILIHALQKGYVKVSFPEPDVNVAQIVDGACYKTLNRIKAIIEDDSLEDPECFMKIEEIICAFEEIGSGGGVRHDFG